MAIAYAAPVREAQLNAITTFTGGSALLRFYDGSRPATGGAATTKLAELVCNATFAPAASGGALTLNAIASDASADATGTATWFRIVKADGTTHVMDGNVGTSGSDLNMSSVSFVATAVIAVSSFVITGGNA